jgi:hypothetical protein
MVLFAQETYEQAHPPAPEARRTAGGGDNAIHLQLERLFYPTHLPLYFAELAYLRQNLIEPPPVVYSLQ